MTTREMSGRRINGAENSSLVVTVPDGTGDPAAQSCSGAGAAWSSWVLVLQEPSTSSVSFQKAETTQTPDRGESRCRESAPLSVDAHSCCPSHLVALGIGSWDRKALPKNGWDGFST